MSYSVRSKNQKRITKEGYTSTAYHLMAIINYKNDEHLQCIGYRKSLIEFGTVSTREFHTEIDMKDNLEVRMSRDTCQDYGHVVTCLIMVNLRNATHQNIQLKVKTIDIAEPNTPDCDYGGLLIYDSPRIYADEFIFPSVLCRKYYLPSQDKYLYPFTEYFTRDNVIYLSYHSYSMTRRDGSEDGVSIILQATKCQGIHHVCQPKVELTTPLVPVSSDGFAVFTHGKISSDCMNHTSRDPIGDRNRHRTDHYIEREGYTLCRISSKSNGSYMTNYIPYENTECLRIQYHPRFQPPGDSTWCGSSVFIQDGNSPKIDLKYFNDGRTDMELEVTPLFKNPSLDLIQVDLVQSVQKLLPKSGYYNISFDTTIGQMLNSHFSDDPFSNILLLDREYSGSYVLKANRIQFPISIKESFHLAHWDLTAGEYSSLVVDGSSTNDCK